MTSLILLDPSNSAGFGGRWPLVIRWRFPTDTSWTGGLTSRASSRIMSVTPQSFRTLSRVWRDGRRRSQSTTITRLPACAIVTARLASVVDLPSSEPAEVTTMERRGLSSAENSRFVRRVRKASATGERGLVMVTREFVISIADLLPQQRAAE